MDSQQESHTGTLKVCVVVIELSRVEYLETGQLGGDISSCESV